MKVGVVGIGRVGLPFAAVASRHFDTIGVDINQALVNSVNELSPFAEPGLNEYLKQFGLKASTDFGKLSDRDLVFFFVGSQTPGSGYSCSKLLASFDKALPHLTSNQVIVISTTLPPGEIDSILLPHLRKSGTVTQMRGIVYNPAMIALGNVIKDFENPNYILIGESDPSAGGEVETFWREVAGRDVPILRGSYKDIALGKYLLNMALVLKISLMNLATELSEKMGCDVDFMSEILKADPRIAGRKMFRGGLGYGGTCFPVDIEAIRFECERLGIPTEITDAVTSLNNWQIARSVSLIKSFGKKKIALLGVTYKPNTSVTVASQALEIGRLLAREQLDVMLYDPEGQESAKKELGSSVHYRESAKEAIASADLVFIAVDWPEFSSLRPSDFREDQVVVDPWRILRHMKLPCRYYGYGVGVQ